LAEWISGAGIARPFDDFGRGVISSSSVVYFVLVATVALYACMVLIGRRHWTGGKDGNTMAWHYLARVLALIGFTTGAVVLFRDQDVVRHDLTEGKVSSLAPATKKLIRELKAGQPIVIDAFISVDIPEVYAQTRYELINLLKEFRSEAAKRGRTIEVNLYEDIELFSDEATLANERFGIAPVTRLVREKGAPQQKQMILGAAFKSGLQKVTVPIFEYGIPVEYELVRSINTVASGKRKRLGIIPTEANLFGGTVMQGMGMQRVPKHLLVEELSKQYDVEAVNMNAPISPDIYSALVVVQPSSLAPPAFDRLLQAVNAGIPVAIFEAPAPVGTSHITPTGSPKQAPGGMFGGGGGPQPKGDIRKLWEALELDVPGQPGMQGMFTPDLVWQDHNPYPILEGNATPLWVFIDEDAPGVKKGKAMSAASPITDGLNEVLAIVPGAVNAKTDGKLKHTPLLITSELSGLVPGSKLREIMGRETTVMRETQGVSPFQSIAMSIEGSAPSESDSVSQDDASEQDASDDDAETPVHGSIKAVYVADADLMLPDFSMIRADPNTMTESRFQFQNVTFILNCIDWLTGELAFVEVRKHEPIIASLRMIDSVKEVARKDVREGSKKFQDIADDAETKARDAMTERLQSLQEELQELTRKSADGSVSRAAMQAMSQRFEMQQEAEQRKLDVKIAKTARDRQLSVREIERKAADEVTSIQNKVKTAAVALPCIPPLIVGVIVFASRRLRERENISKNRLK